MRSERADTVIEPPVGRGVRRARNAGAVLARVGACAVALLATGAVGVGGSVVTSEPAAVRAMYEGVCTDNVGVTVVIDFQELGGGVNVRCAPGPVGSGLDAFDRADISWEGTLRFPGFVCRIAGQPTPASEACGNTPPASAYWSYWLAPRGGGWCYSNFGAGNRTPPPGSVEGWSFALDKSASEVPPPRFDPPPAIPGQPPNLLSTADCTSAANPGVTTTSTTTTSTTTPSTTTSTTTTSRPGNPATTSPSAITSPSATTSPSRPGNASSATTQATMVTSPVTTRPSAPGAASATTAPPSRGPETTRPPTFGSGDASEDVDGRDGLDSSGDGSIVAAGSPTDSAPDDTDGDSSPSDDGVDGEADGGTGSAGDRGSNGSGASDQESVSGSAAGAGTGAGSARGNTPTAPMGDVDLSDDGRSGGGFGVGALVAIVSVCALAAGAVLVSRRRRTLNWEEG